MARATSYRHDEARWEALPVGTTLALPGDWCVRLPVRTTHHAGDVTTGDSHGHNPHPPKG